MGVFLGFVSHKSPWATFWDDSAEERYSWVEHCCTKQQAWLHTQYCWRMQATCAPSEKWECCWCNRGNSLKYLDFPMVVPPKIFWVRRQVTKGAKNQTCAQEYLRKNSLSNCRYVHFRDERSPFAHGLPQHPRVLLPVDGQVVRQTYKKDRVNRVRRVQPDSTTLSGYWILIFQPEDVNFTLGMRFNLAVAVWIYLWRTYLLLHVTVQWEPWLWRASVPGHHGTVHQYNFGLRWVRHRFNHLLFHAWQVLPPCAFLYI